MPSWSGLGDFTTNNLPNLGGRGRQNYRPSNAINTYLPGIVVQLTAINSQILPDFQTVQPTPAAAGGTKLAGVVAPDWNGFDNNGLFTSVASQLNVRGTNFIGTTVKGIAYVWIDQSGGAAVTCVDGLPLSTSSVTAGYAQGSSLVLTACAALVGVANLPSSGIGSSLTAAALAQATVTYTVATPAAGDTISATIQAPYNDLQPGTVQTFTVSLTLNATTAASATTAAAAFVAALQANPYFATSTGFGTGGYFTAANALGVVTITVNTAANQFLVTGGSTSAAGTAIEQWRFYTAISGMVANTLTTTAAVSGGGGTTFVAGAGTFTGGTGFKGKIPLMVYGMY
jgi:hypothetical protein